ncbi:hypothetical protein U1839_21785 [Sphingomonas sp. RT2P30]|uniref:hypothetical protein n=1 Tax=Parasphingomonas halimpatiens TaxID=3096162 RepID=UPI002FC59AA2
MASRRQVMLGSVLVVASPAFARPATAIVPFQLRVAIPSSGVLYGGLLFGGGVKALIEGTIDLARSGAAAMSVTTRFLGATRQYAAPDAVALAGKPSWFVGIKPGAVPTKTGQAVVNDTSLGVAWTPPPGATHGLTLTVNAANPLVPAAPAIDAKFVLGLRMTGSVTHYILSAQHDGFPDYGFRLGAGAPVYGYDCVTAGDSPLALFPPMERSGGTSAWTAFSR